MNSSTNMPASSKFFFFNDTATTEIYTLSLHDALPIWSRREPVPSDPRVPTPPRSLPNGTLGRSEEHTSELQSQSNLVCRLLLEKKKQNLSYASNSHHYGFLHDPLTARVLSDIPHKLCL